MSRTTRRGWVRGSMGKRLVSTRDGSAATQYNCHCIWCRPRDARKARHDAKAMLRRDPEGA